MKISAKNHPVEAIAELFRTGPESWFIDRLVRSHRWPFVGDKTPSLFAISEEHGNIAVGHGRQAGSSRVHLAELPSSRRTRLAYSRQRRFQRNCYRKPSRFNSIAKARGFYDQLDVSVHQILSTIFV